MDVKEAINLLSNPRKFSEPSSTYNEAIETLLDLAERYEAVKDRFPDKYENAKNPYSFGFNDAIDECALAITKAVPTVEEIQGIMCKHVQIISDSSSAYKAIHNLFMDRLNNKGGKKDE